MSIVCKYMGRFIYCTKESGKHVYYCLDEEDKRHSYNTIKEVYNAIDKHWINGKWYVRC